MQPQRYTPITSFESDEANAVSGRSTVRTAALDTELANVEVSLNEAITNLGLIQRDDGQLRDFIVGVNALSAAVLAFMGSAGFTISNPLGWLTATAYPARAIVTHGTGTFVSAVAHTSGTFATDLAAGKWAQMFDSTLYLAANITFTPVGTISSTNVQDAIAEVATDTAQTLLGYARVIDTVALLKALPVPSTAITCVVRSYAVLGDGGGGFYWWNSADTTADNGGTVLVCTANGTNPGRFNKLF